MEDLFGKMQELLSDPESMKQISELAQMLQTDNESSVPTVHEEPPKMQPDMSALLQVGELFKNQKADKNTALLLALRPHLGENRQKRVDQAVRMLRLWEIWQTLQKSGMLQNLL
ncbi:MAG TPA: hypothetical protein DCO72_10220 [Ruminococcus sp.]|nr:hypothetical protein [Ruminococcus sp.]